MAQEIADSTLLDTWSSSGLKVEPDVSKIIEGWQLGEQPPHEYMNWLQNTFGSKLNHILKNGVSSWNNETQYLAGSSVQHNGNVWLCKVTNTNSAPTDANTNWKRIITVESLTTVLAGYVATTGNQTIAGVKTFSSSPVVPTPTTNTQAANKQYVDSTITDRIGLIEYGYVATTGNQTIAGVKTFSSSPIVPTPTANIQAANKKYVDDATNRIGLIDYGYVATTYHIVAFGGEFNRADYPKLWAYLNANPHLVGTEVNWQKEVAAQGGICGFFSDGNGTTTFRVPNLDKAFLRPDSRGVGRFQEGSYISGDANVTGANATGLVNYNDDVSAFRDRMNWDNLAPTKIGDSNLITVYIHGTSNFTNLTIPSSFGVTRPKNIAVLPLIVAK